MTHANLDAKRRLIPPPSVEAGRTRLSQLAVVMADIESDLTTRPQAEFPSVRAYAEWRTRAVHNLGHLRRERAQLERWLADCSGDSRDAEVAAAEAFWRE